jgi:hypothetical protein
MTGRNCRERIIIPAVIPQLRKNFNAEFSAEKYQRFLTDLETAAGVKIEFRTCETPVFVPPGLLAEMHAGAKEMIAQLSTPAYHEASTRAIAPEFNTPNEGAHPDFIQVDFAVTRAADGRLRPKLIELQGCASLYAFQFLLPHVYNRHYDLGGLDYLLGGLTDESYLKLLADVLLNGHAPENVVLLEIDPEHQKTRPDFTLTEKYFGIPAVCISKVAKRGNRLFYQRDGREIAIERIYNRVIIDEFVRKDLKIAFDFRDELAVEWAGHPNWYFRISKYSLPFLKHPAVPRAWFLNEVDRLSADLEHFVLKPLFSFAGSGVKVSLTQKDLDEIPAERRGEYLLQEKVAYAPVIETPEAPSKVEIRMMFVWPQNAPEPVALTFLTRLSQGAMMGVDFNKNKTWVGSSCAFFPTP